MDRSYPQRRITWPSTVFLALICQAALFSQAMVWGGTLQLAIDRESGGVALRNSTAEALEFTAYSITSVAGNLIFPNWTSIAGNYDADGDMSVDDNDPWLQLSAEGSNSDLSEAEFNGDGGVLPAGGAISLGAIWDTQGVEDLAIDVVLLSGEFSESFDVIYYEENADFNEDGRIDGLDFLIWQLGYGLPMDASLADGDADADGDVDTQDFLIWQGQFASALASARGAGELAPVSANTPEPASASLLFCVWLVSCGLRRSRRG